MAGRRLGVLRPERRASIRARVLRHAPLRDVSRGCSGRPGYLTRRRASQAAEVEDFLAQGSECGAGAAPERVPPPEEAAAAARTRPLPRPGSPGPGPGTLRIATRRTRVVLPTGSLASVDGSVRGAQTCTRPAGSATLLRLTSRHSAPARVSLCARRLLERRDGERHAEAERRDEADRLAAAQVGLGDHRLRQHRQDRPAGEGEHEGDGVRRCVARAVAARTARPDARLSRPQSPRMRAAAWPATARPLVAPIASGRFERKTATIMATETPPPSRSVRPITTDSGSPVQDDAEHDRQRRALLLLAAHALSLLAAAAVDQLVAEEVCESARREPGRHRGAAFGGREGVLDELVGNGTGGRPLEAEEQADHAAADPDSEGDQPADREERIAARMPQAKAALTGRRVRVRTSCTLPPASRL